MVGTGPLSGLRVIEVSSFVASPLGGMTLAQLGAEVIRIDPVGGAPDTRRWPLAPSTRSGDGNVTGGTSLYWTGLNKGKRSVILDLRAPAGQDALQKLITAPGEGGGILLTNQAGRHFMSYAALAELRSDVIVVELTGRADGSPAVDYTINAELGFPLVTGPPEISGAVNHVLPAWDVACGLYAALAIVAAERTRRLTGAGAYVTAALGDVALATAGNLGMLAEAELGGVRERIGNHLFGSFAHDFATADGRRVMVVALTPRHFKDLVTLTGMTEAVDAVETALKADFSTDGDRYIHRDVLVGLLRPWFASRPHAEVAAGLASTSVLWSTYRTFTEAVAAAVDNPMMSVLDQPGVGKYLAPGNPLNFAGADRRAVTAPALGQDTEEVLRSVAGCTQAQIADLFAAGAAVGPQPGG
ncbi:MAG TPA: CoA transferase [Sporichthyaceae bacterium]|nr:CoA transferase [Sporichthyaceae bacterium]